jgi:hypothetical protein
MYTCMCSFQYMQSLAYVHPTSPFNHVLKPNAPQKIMIKVVKHPITITRYFEGKPLHPTSP